MEEQKDIPEQSGMPDSLMKEWNALHDIYESQIVQQLGLPEGTRLQRSPHTNERIEFDPSTFFSLPDSDVYAQASRRIDWKELMAE